MHYAAITCSGKIMSKGHASFAGSSKICDVSITRHAEMDAIYKIHKSKRLRKRAILWSLRWKGDGNGNYILGNARPCLNCKRFAEKNGIRWCYYSTDDGLIKKEEIKDMCCKLTNSTQKMLKW